MGIFYSSRKEFAELKKPQKLFRQVPENVQETLEILRIAPGGVMEVEKNLYSKSYQIEDSNYNTLTYEEQLEFFLRWSKLISSIDNPFKITIINQLQNMTEFHEKILYQKKWDHLDEAREAFNEIIETKMLEGRHGIEQIKILTLSVKRNNYEEANNYFSTVEASLFRNFAGLKSTLLPLNANEKLQLLYNFYHIGEEDYNIDIAKLLKEGKDWRNELSCDMLDFTGSDKYFRTEKKYCTAMYVVPGKYPATITDEFLNKLVSFNEPSIFSIDFVPVSQTLLKKVLDVKLAGIESSISRQQQKHNDQKNFSSEISYKVRKQKQSIEDMIQDVEVNDQKIFWTGINYVLMGDDKKKMENAIASINLVLDHDGFKAETYKMRQREGFNTVLPIGVRQVDQMRGLLTNCASAYHPFFAKDIYMKDGSFFYGVNQLSKRIIMGDRKKLENASGFVVGIPGSGKSFTGSKLEIGQVLINTNDDIIIIDPTYEYINVSKAFVGEILYFADYAQTFINPFDFDTDLCDDKRKFNQLKKEKSQLMMGICSQCMTGEFHSGHYSIVDRCVRILLEQIALEREGERQVPLMSDFREILSQQPEPQADDIALALERFTEGSLDMFNHQTNINIENRLMVYACRDIGEQLMNIAMVIMLDNITNRILHNMNQGKATWLYIDEFHIFLQNPYTRDYFITLWAKIRKVGGVPTGITQNPSMILSDSKISSLLMNSEYVMIMKVDGPDAEEMIRNFEWMSGAMKDYMTQAERGMGVIRFGNTVVPFDCRIEKESPVYDLYNTDFHEKARVKQSLEKLKRDEQR